MTKDGLGAMAVLWQCFVVLTALLFMVIVAVTAASVTPAPLDDASPPSDRKWAALWLLIVLGYAIYMLRKYFWQPIIRLFACPLGARDVWNLIMLTAVAAVPYGAILGLWVGICFEYEDSRYIFLFILPIVLLWDWGMGKAEAHARWVLGVCGLVEPMAET